jgi:hypothetical protein
MSLLQRISKLERTAAALNLGACPLCGGFPFVVLNELTGPAGRRCSVDLCDRARVTSDGGRCIRCGVPVRQRIILESLADDTPMVRTDNVGT